MSLDNLQIHVDAFEGPLDLLLHLIRRNEVEITDIPIAKLTEQFLATLQGGGGIDRIDIELAGEFLVMAATLMEIKSRMLMPVPAADAETSDPLRAPKDSEDPRADLVRQLLAYKRFRDAAGALDRRHTEWERRFPGGGALVPSLPQTSDDDEPIDLEDVDITDLTRAFAAIMDTVDFTRVGEHHVRDDETPIEIHAQDILERLRSSDPAMGSVEFKDLFAGRSRSEMIGLFLAMLELIRQNRINAKQDAINGNIVIRATAAAEPVQPDAQIDGRAAQQSPVA